MVRACTRLVVYSFAVVACLCGARAPSFAEEAMRNLEVFSDAPLEKGLWRMEILESSNPALVAQSAKMGKTAICIDVARELSKGKSDDDESDCEQKVVSDTSSSAEILVTCPDGNSTVKISRAGDKTYTFNSSRTGKEGDVETMNGRYTYQGPCKGDALVEMDRDSEACQKMRAQMQGQDLAAMCAKVPEDHRATCEQKMKTFATMCN